MQGFKSLKQKIEQRYLDELDEAAEQRIRLLDVLDTVREMTIQNRREAKAAPPVVKGESP